MFDNVGAIAGPVVPNLRFGTTGSLKIVKPLVVPNSSIYGRYLYILYRSLLEAIKQPQTQFSSLRNGVTVHLFVPVIRVDSSVRIFMFTCFDASRC